MRAAVWLDLISMFLWFATTVLGIAWCIRTRKVTRQIDYIEPGQEELEAPRREQVDINGEKEDLPTYEKAMLEGPMSKKHRNSVDTEVQPPTIKGYGKGKQ